VKYIPAAVLAACLSFPALSQPVDDGLVGMTRAIGSAERTLSARAIEAELETRDGRLVYEIDLVRSDTLHRATVDARSGRLVTSEKPRLENWLRAWIARDRIRAGGAAEPLAGRLAILEKQSRGEVKEVEFDMRNGKAVYEIEIATAAGIGEVHIDAATGKRLALAYDD